jgi:chaperonin GroES
MIIPLGNRVLVEGIVDEKDYGIVGFVKPDSGTDKPENYKVVALGSGEDLDELGLSVGDTVVINKYAGSDTKFEEISYKIVKSGDVQAKVV